MQVRHIALRDPRLDWIAIQKELSSDSGATLTKTEEITTKIEMCWHRIDVVIV